MGLFGLGILRILHGAIRVTLVRLENERPEVYGHRYVKVSLAVVLSFV
jgi:hypothetical protein